MERKITSFFISFHFFCLSLLIVSPDGSPEQKSTEVDQSQQKSTRVNCSQMIALVQAKHEKVKDSMTFKDTKSELTKVNKSQQ